ncbi:threonylcarbamoyl-AMP synthase [bacterium]|nr:threonylcarbamoyl-AMP synthase [bacterium]
MEISINDFLNKELKDEVFIIETDTVYGLGALLNSKEGANRILKIKERNQEKHFSLLVSNLDQVSQLTTNYKEVIDLLNRYWPGALTIIFKKSELVPNYVSSDDTVGLRMPDNEKTLKVLEKFGPMIMTSLNKSGEPAITKYSDCLKYLDKVDYIVKGEDLNGIPSTVYDAEKGITLREGSIKIF